MDRTGLMHAPQLSAARQLWNFVRHFLEMCIAMCVVGTPVVLLLTRVLPSSLGWPVPADTAPEVTVLIVAAVYTLPMVAWMRFRGMDWRPVLEMGGATFAVGVGLVALAWLGLLSRTGLGDFASPAFCTPACAVMFLAMLPRLDMYTGRSGHQMGNGGRMAHAM